MSIRSTLLSILRHLQERGPYVPFAGICSFVETELLESDKYPGAFAARFEIRAAMKELFKSWPDFSGDEKFPVTIPRRDPFNLYISDIDKWTGKYGDARHSLLKFMVEQLEAQEMWADAPATLDALKLLRDNGPTDPVFGICTNVHNQPLTSGELLDNLFPQWDEYSGNSTYPVPHPDGIEPDKAYCLTANLWEGEYGAARKRLLAFLIERLEQGINK